MVELLMVLGGLSSWTERRELLQVRRCKVDRLLHRAARDGWERLEGACTVKTTLRREGGKEAGLLKRKRTLEGPCKVQYQAQRWSLRLRQCRGLLLAWSEEQRRRRPASSFVEPPLPLPSQNDWTLLSLFPPPFSSSSSVVVRRRRVLPVSSHSQELTPSSSPSLHCLTLV
jgi:hypothetical protein